MAGAVRHGAHADVGGLDQRAGGSQSQHTGVLDLQRLTSHSPGFVPAIAAGAAAAGPRWSTAAPLIRQVGAGCVYSGADSSRSPGPAGLGDRVG
jgi:hypothetical protein